MAGARHSDGSVHLYFVNAAPTYDETTESLAQQSVTGANGTIEAFNLPDPATSDTLKHLHTFYHRDLITTPNRPAPLPDGTIYITNDHGPHRAGLGHALSPVIRTGTIVHCAPPTVPGAQSTCTPVGGKHAFPNGLHYSTQHNELYVPSSVTGQITVYAPPPHNTVANSTLTRVADVPVGYPLDNISEDDGTGDLWVAGFPKLSEMMDLFKPATPIDGRGAPTASFRVRRTKSDSKDDGDGAKGQGKAEWEVHKVVEDANAEILPTATTVVRDGKTGRLFFVGVVSPWIAVCEPK